MGLTLWVRCAWFCGPGYPHLNHAPRCKLGPLATPCNRGCCVAWPDGDDTPRKWPSWAGAPMRWLGSEGLGYLATSARCQILALWHSRSEWHLALWHSTLFGTWHFGTRDTSGTWHSGTRMLADKWTLPSSQVHYLSKVRDSFEVVCVCLSAQCNPFKNIRSKGYRKSLVAHVRIAQSKNCPLGRNRMQSPPTCYSLILD